jgi:tRNA 2-thiocytidine biosynthesis protein TtcA
MERFTGLIRRCVEDYSMIKKGDKIAVGVSGGKDSLALLCALNNLRRYYPETFDLCAITLDMGFEGMDFTPVQELCRRFGIPHVLKHTQLKQIIFDQRKEKNPCALCAKMRRGALHDTLLEIGYNKIALGHHFDDAVETFVLSLVYEGRISCFQPVTYMSRKEITQIRPMLYVGEGTVQSIVDRYQLPVVKNRCEMDGNSKREDVKRLVKSLQKDYPDLKTKIFGAMQRLPLDGWEPAEYARRPLP